MDYLAFCLILLLGAPVGVTVVMRSLFTNEIGRPILDQGAKEQPLTAAAEGLSTGAGRTVAYVRVGLWVLGLRWPELSIRWADHSASGA